MGKQSNEKNKKKLDKVYRKKLSKRAEERILSKIEAKEPSECQHPSEFLRQIDSFITVNFKVIVPESPNGGDSMKHVCN